MNRMGEKNQNLSENLRTQLYTTTVQNTIDTM